MGILFTLAKALLFEWKSLNIKQLTDRGIPVSVAFYYERLAFYPSILLVVATFKKEYVEAILDRPLFMGALVFSFLFWVLQEYIGFYLVESVQNLGFLSAFSMAMTLPVYATMGWLVNGDIPSTLMLAALTILTIAMFLNPAVNESGKTVFRKSFLITAGIALLGIVFDAANVALGRFLFTNIQSTLFLVGLFSTLSCLSIHIFFLFHKRPSLGKVTASRKLQLLAYSIPTLWFLGSIPEGYSLARIPIFAVVAISSTTFLIDIASDLRNKRVTWTMRTAVFTLLVVAGVSLAALATS